MRKILIVFLALIVAQINCEAKDYAKAHMKQMKKNQEYRISNTYLSDYKPEQKTLNLEIKDPKLIKLGGYENIPVNKFKEKRAKDEQEYKKISAFLASKKLNEYYMQAYNEDFFRVYRVAERLIRANNLDFMNWRLSIDSENSFNAYNSQTNRITVLVGTLDTLRGNDDALALIMGHEIAHGLMGHTKRQAKYRAKVERALRLNHYGAYHIALKRYNKASRDMEYEADVVGAKLVAKAGYNLSNARETLSYMNTLDDADELNSTHPTTEKRIKNFEQNRKYFMDSEWVKQGLYNIYKSDVIECEKSSNRNSIVLLRGKTSNYSDESIDEMYLRYGYKSYVNGEFKEAIKYFKNYLKLNKGNYAVYLYISYANECLYKQTGNAKYLESAKEFAGYAKTIEPDNKYVKEQILSL